MDSKREVIGSTFSNAPQNCTGTETGGVWDTATGHMRPLQNAGSLTPASPKTITSSGQIFGLDGSFPAMWADSKASPVLLTGIGWPSAVSGDGGYLIATSPSGGGYVLYKKIPTLKVSISFPGSPGGIAPNPAPGDIFTADVTVANLSPDVHAGSISHLVFASGKPIEVDPSNALAVVSGPSPPSPFTLAPGTQRSFTYKLRAAHLGHVQLASEISGKDSGGLSVSAGDSVTVVVGNGLKVDLSYTPTKLQLPVDAKGDDIPQPFSVKVRVTNGIGKTVHNVKLEKLPILEKMGADIAVPIEQDLKKKQPRLNLGSLAPNQSASVRFPFLADTDGQGRVSWTAYAPNPDNPNDTIRGVGSTVVSIDPTVIVKLNLNLRTGGGSFVTSGDYATVGAVVTNLTNADAVTLDQLNPTLTGNAGEGNPIDPTNPPPPNVYPVAVAPKLGPGEVKALIADVQTVQSQGTRGTVQYKVTGKVEKPDGTKASLSQAQVVYDPKDATETIHIDDSVPTYDPDSKLKAAVANYAIGFAEGEEQWFKSTFDTAAWALKAAPGAILDVQKAPIELLQCIDYYVTYWSYLNVSARLAFIDEIGRGVLAQTDQLGKTIDQVDANIAAKLTSWSNTLETAWDTGDWPDVARSAGRVSGNLAVEAATWEVHLPEAAKLIKLGDAAKEAGVAKRVAEGLRALEAGDELSDAALFELYGIDAEQAAAFRELSQEKGLLIAPRYRNPLSIAWEELGALPKMEAVKLKNVDEIDAAFLEYRSGDVGSVVLKRPLTPAELHATAAYENASPTLKEAADIRLEARQKEWVKFQANEPGYNYSQMAKPFDEGGGVTVPESYQGWNYKANGSALPAPDPTVAIKRRFEMAQVGNEEYWVLKAADRNGVLQRITGDIDIVAITKANGQLLSPAEKLDIYRNLQDTVGMQHGDTFNWLENGELLG
ncbi:MAG TPA: hypothetical protein VG815_00355, partial [Chloroflexota bacterium]|nr:hypothetical protein [Chloroflexota bacterium]